MRLLPNTAYFFKHADLSPDATAQDILVKKARSTRDFVRRWWVSLEPEYTSGVPVDLMESSLMALAKTLERFPGRRIARYQVVALVTRQLGSIQGRAEQKIAERFLGTAAMLGLLTPGGSLGFAHPSLLDLYLGLAYHRESVWPKQLERAQVFSPKPSQEPWGRATWARLSFTEPEKLEEAFTHVAGLNLHLASWFLYCNPEARERLGGDFAASMFELASWDTSLADQEVLDQSLASLGVKGAEAARSYLFERDSTLPVVRLAARALHRCGSANDIEKLTALAALPRLGWWEIERMRDAIREAQSLTLDPETLRRYRKEELVEFGKGALKVLVMIVGAVLAAQLMTTHRLGSFEVSKEAAHAGAHQIAHGVGHLAEGLSEGSVDDVLALQRTLREKLASLPSLIERRKGEVERLQPLVRQELQAATEAIAARERAASRS